jgi:ubiquinone/menaquinone biosynthesis C-methylase UbiE
MKFITCPRVPLREMSFTGIEAAQFYDEHARRFMKPVYRRLAKKAARISLAGTRVLDIGTGSGYLAMELARARSDWYITGTDISEDMLRLARQNASRGGLTERTDFLQAPASTLPFTDGYFSIVTSNASLHLWTDPLKVLREIERVTSPGGYCLIWDTMRLSVLSPLISLVGWVMGMNAAQRQLWMQARRASYTIGEARTLLSESTLKDARVRFIPGLLYLGIAWRKPSV